MTVSLGFWVAWLVESSLKAGILALIVLTVTGFLGTRLSVRWKHALWMLVLMRALMPAMPESSISLFNLLGVAQAPDLSFRVVERLETIVQDSRTAVVSDIQPRQRRSDHGSTMLLFAAWVSVAALLLARVARRAMRVRRMIARSEEVAVTSPLAELLASVRTELGIRRHVRLLITDVVRAPALFGMVRPAILIPVDVAREFDAEELRHILLHELSHLRRGDLWIDSALLVVTALHWFNPLLWFAAARIREDRELVCDELALSCLEEDERICYGRTLLRLLARFRAPDSLPALVGITARRKYMTRRIEMIANYEKRGRLPLLSAALLTAIAAVGFTDARGGERIMVRTMAEDADPQLRALDRKVTFSLENASLTDLLSAVTSASGVVITPGAEAAQSPAQSARFTINAVNVPALLLLREALGDFDLAPKFSEDGTVQIVASERMHFEHIAVDGTRRNLEEFTIRAAPDEERSERRVVVRTGEHPATDATVRADQSGERHSFRHIVKVDAQRSEHSDLAARRELKLSFNENGVESEGSLTLQVTSPN